MTPRRSRDNYRFTLNNSCGNFHSGEQLKVEDVIATYESVLEKRNASPYRSRLLLIDRFEITNDKTFDVYLNKADPLFPGYLDIGIVPKRLIDAGHNFTQNQ